MNELEKADENDLFESLLGPSFPSPGGLFMGQINSIRKGLFTKILFDTNKTLKENNIPPKKIPLKTLVPIIENSSLEEDETMQKKWSNLIYHVVGGDKEEVFHHNAITILSKIASDDAKLLDRLFDSAYKQFEKRYPKSITQWKTPDYVGLTNFPFTLNLLAHELNVEISELEFSISNLISLGLLKWETTVNIHREGPESLTKIHSKQQKLDLKVKVSNNNKFIFTSIGFRFVKICRE